MGRVIVVGSLLEILLLKPVIAYAIEIFDFLFCVFSKLGGLRSNLMSYKYLGNMIKTKILLIIEAKSAIFV